MAFITEFNLKRLIVNCDLKNVEFNCQVFETTRIFILSNLEVKRLQAVQEFLKNGEHYILNYYKPLENSIDTQKYIYEGSTPSYHSSSSCESLRSDYRNYEIPLQIKERN